MHVVEGLIVGNPDDTRESIEANLAFARRYVNWPYIQHPTPYPRTPMAQHFRERGLITNERLEEYDGTTAVVRTEHLAAEEIEYLRWKAERWMKLRHIPRGSSSRSQVRSESRSGDVSSYLSWLHAAFSAGPGRRSKSLRAVQGNTTRGTGVPMRSSLHDGKTNEPMPQ